MELRSGYTTGSSVAAGILVALKVLDIDRSIDISDNFVELLSLSGEKLKAEILRIKKNQKSVTVAIKKDAGDDPDVTNGIAICVKVKKISESEYLNYQNQKAFVYESFILTGGRGVGVVTKAGLTTEVGKYAINPYPRKMVEDILKNYHLEDKLLIQVFVPEGLKKSKYTLNSKLGIIGGISILGTTGVVKPMSEERLMASLLTELKVVKSNSSGDFVVFSFGNYGERFCESIGIDRSFVVVISNYIGFVLEKAKMLGFKKILLLGHIGKGVKIAGGIFNTHSKVADARLEILAANAFLYGIENIVIRKILESNTVDEASKYIEDKTFFNFLSNKIKSKSESHVQNELTCECLLFDFSGSVLGYSDNFYSLVSEVV